MQLSDALPVPIADRGEIPQIESYLPQDFGWISSPKLFSKKFSTMVVIVV